MTTDNEPAKLLLPYLQRADELQKHEPLVAYYCRLYAMERGVRFPQKERAKTTNALLVSLMNQLEKDKKSLQLGPDDNLHVEGFALNVFAKADKQDRAGRADLYTAKTFYAASIFFEILNQFGELQPDLEQKQKYAAWKAVDISKALKEGRNPLPGPPGGDKDLAVPSTSSGDEYDIEPIRPDSSRIDPSTTTAPDSDSDYDKVNSQNPTNISPQSSNITPPSNISTPHHNPTLPQNYPSQNVPSSSYPDFQPHPSFTESNLPAAPSRYPSYYQGSDPPYSNLPPTNTAQYDSIARNGSVLEASQTTTSKYEYGSNYEPTPEQIAEAQKAARFAVGALAFDDVFVAVDYLKKSLELLTKPSVGN